MLILIKDRIAAKLVPLNPFDPILLLTWPPAVAISKSCQVQLTRMVLLILGALGVLPSFTA